MGLNMGIAWEEALHSALMPITPQASMGSLADSKQCYDSYIIQFTEIRNFARKKKKILALSDNI